MRKNSKLRAIFTRLESKFHKERQKDTNELELAGKWIVYQPAQNTTVPLVINPDGNSKYNKQLLKGEITYSSSKKLTIKDHYGYQLTIQKKDNNNYILYDELGEEKYPIKKQNEIEKGFD